MAELHNKSTEHNSVFKLTPKDPDAYENAKKTIFAKYPRIYLMIEAAWGSKELHQKLSSLLQSDNAIREGFPIEVCEALMVIQEEHADTFGFAPFADSNLTGRWPDQW